MKKRAQKILSVALSVFLILSVLSVIPFTASAETTSGSCGTNVTWSYNSSTLTISGTGWMSDYRTISTNKAPWSSYSKAIYTVVIASGVTHIGDYAFYGCDRITKITIPDSVTSVGIGALSDTAWYNNQPDGLVYAGKVPYKYKGNCPASVTINEGTLSITGGAFYGCTGLTSITIPDSVTSIGEYAFCGCTGLTSITIPDNVTSIGNCAFDGCTGLTSVTIGKAVKSIRQSAFYGCTGLTRVNYTGDIAGWCSIDFYGPSTNPLSWAHNLYINNELVTDLIIPDSVTSIGKAVFSGCTSLTNVTIPERVTSIGREAFSSTGLTSVTVPESVTSVGIQAFLGCTGLKTAGPIGGGYDYEFGWAARIPNNAFSNCSELKSITIPVSVTFIDDSAFKSCGLKDVFYKGTSEQKAGISIGSDNSPLTDAIWHYITNLNYNPPTCTEPGYTGDMGWAGYDEIVTHGEEIPALGHNYNENVTTNPNCTEFGYTTHICSHCGDSYTDSYTNAIGHSYSIVTTKPTCTEQGYTTHTCSRCGDSYKDNFIAALGHVGGAANCHAKAVCTRCGKEYGALDLNNHDGETGIKNAKNSTCTTNGYTGDTYCLGCGKRIATGSDIPALGHNYSALLTSPTCTEQGYTTHTCSHCGDSYKDDFNAAFGHTGGTATCHSKAVCTRCRNEYGEYDANNHDGATEIRNAKLPNCTETGYTGDTYCLSCGKRIATGSNINVSGHNYIAVVTRPTCTARGYTTYTCENCGDSYVDDYVSPIGHTITEIRNAKPADCANLGYTGDTYCLICGERIAVGKRTPITEHTPGEWIISKKATFTETGTQYRKCRMCGTIIDYEELPVIDPNAPIIEVDSVCKDIGKTIDVKIKLLNNPGITSAKLKVYFPDDLVLTAVTFGDIDGQTITSPTLSSPIILNWFNGLEDLNSPNTVFATLTFKTTENTVIGKKDITVQYDQNDIFNIANNNVYFAIVDGGIDVTAYTPGDINGDDAVNNKDLTRLFQYLSDWDVEVDEAALDVNGDGAVNNKDLTRLFQYLSDWDVEIF